MGNLRKIIRIGYVQLLKSLTTPCLWVALALQILQSLYRGLKFLNYAQALKCPVNCIEGYLCMLSSEYVVTVVMFIYLLAISDVPFLKLGYVGELTRVSRTQWYLGKIMFLLIVAVLQQMLMIGLSILILISQSFWGDIWSYSFYGVVNNMASQAFGLSYVGIDVMRHFTPLTAVLAQAGLMILVNLMMGIILLNISLIRGKILGYISLVVVHIVGFFIYDGSSYMWTPIQNVLINHVVNYGVVRSVIYGITLNIVVVIAGLFIVDKVSLAEAQ